MDVQTRRAAARALVARLSRQANALRGRELLGPLLPRGRIRTRLGGLVYEFRPRGAFVGWGRFRPLDEHTAELTGVALPWERASYLELFPLLRVVLLWPDMSDKSGGTWWALPYNGSDARQRFGLDPSAPLPVHLCDPTDGAARFARVLARVDGRILLYDGPDPLADPAHAEWLQGALAAEDPPERYLAGLAASERGPRRQRERLREAARSAHLERRLRRALEKADATLLGYDETAQTERMPAGIVVEWGDRDRRHRYRSFLSADLDVVSSGICLSGRDGDFDLTSLVGVMERAP